LKYFVFISFFFFTRTFAQVSPPSLRCLQVSLNGDVQLTWVSAPPNSNFLSYSIYYSISKNGPYTLLTSAVSPINTTTYLHAPATASAQVYFYYMTSNYTSGSSINSDTLNTIFLNIFPGIDDLKLSYLNIRKPPLISSGTTFTITKEKPIGTINVLAVTSSTTYADTIHDCFAMINYRVLLQDNSGCKSESNIIIGQYSNSKTPDTTYVDSISVLPNGNTVIGWQIPKLDPDVDQYHIIQKLNPNSPNQYIDTVNGRTNTSYTLTGNLATSQPVALYVASLDSCGKIGNFDQTPVTMYLKSSYDTCAFTTTLEWTPYKGMRKGLKEYRIYYSIDGINFNRVGSTNDNSMRHVNVDPAKNVCYFIRAVNSDESITASSNRICFFSNQTSAPSFIYLQSATIEDNHPVVKLHVDHTKQNSGISINRSENGIDFTHVGTIPYNGGSFYSFTDIDADPGSKSYFYKAIIKDNCGNSRITSNTARTILLKVTPDKENIFNMNLSWNFYEGYDAGTNSYKVFRVINDGPAIPVTTLLPEVNSYTDNIENEAPNGSDIKYIVQAEESTGNIFNILEYSNSNSVNVYMEGRLFVPTAFAPEGINSIWKPVTHFIDKNDYKVQVYNRWGKKVFETRDDNTGWNGENCIPGVYAYLISYKNARGEYREFNGTVILLK
jgi:hypothetical protein